MTDEKAASLAELLHRLLDEIERKPNLRLLIKKSLEANSLTGRLLISNQDVLFVNEELTEPAPSGATTIRLPVLFWTSMSLSSNPEASLKILSDYVQLRKESTETLKLRWQQILAQVLDVETFRDLAAYFALKFARSTTKTKALIRQKKFSYVDMKRCLGDYGHINGDQLFSEIAAASDNKSEYEFDPLVVRTLTNMPKQLYAAMVADVPGTVLVSAPYPDIMLDELTSQPLKYVKNIEYATKITPREYQECLNELYTLGLLEVIDAIFWCGNREHESLILRTKAKLGPLDTGPSCPKCQQPTNYSVSYQILPDLKECILFAGGGMLNVQVGWILRQKSIKFQACVDVDGNEIDFIIELAKGKWLLECKMHRFDLDPRTFVQTCRKDMQKVEKKVSILKAKGIQPDRKILVLNWPHYAIESTLELAGAAASKVKSSEIEIMGYDVFDSSLGHSLSSNNLATKGESTTASEAN